ncbi:hypothetical protein P7K49_028597 [Saguinus oedipus]|uniref:Uncharacterized protein n=1 Tax=Saguinus oedipus TaxID=9490 RepID=A0ABQ9U4S9_SAGOE|nr:hypothetical protein P7K49_028597 [Saguinus oedipus]
MSPYGENSPQPRHTPRASLSAAGGGWQPAGAEYDSPISRTALVLKVHGVSGSHRGQDRGICQENYTCTKGLKNSEVIHGDLENGEGITVGRGLGSGEEELRIWKL